MRLCWLPCGSTYNVQPRLDLMECLRTVTSTPARCSLSSAYVHVIIQQMLGTVIYPMSNQMKYKTNSEPPGDYSWRRRVVMNKPLVLRCNTRKRVSSQHVTHCQLDNQVSSYLSTGSHIACTWRPDCITSNKVNKVILLLDVTFNLT